MAIELKDEKLKHLLDQFEVIIKNSNNREYNVVKDVLFTYLNSMEKIERGRFIDDDNTILDTKTELIWLKNANRFKTHSWDIALKCCNSLNTFGTAGWRLPTLKEFKGLVDYEQYDPALPLDHPFINVQSKFYWTSTIIIDDASGAWGIDLSNGVVDGGDKHLSHYVWPVRAKS